MKVLIVGVSGCLGQNLAKILLEKNYKVAGLSRNPFELGSPNFSFVQCDAKNKTQLLEVCKKNQPDVVVNTSAKTNVDANEDEKNDAIQTNVGIVETLVEFCEKKIPLVQISTDYVFDGETPPYTENSKPKPLSFYGLTKLQAEEVLQNSNCQWSILRTQILFGVGKNLKADFVSWLVGSLQKNLPVRIVTDQTGNPTLASQLAKAIVQVIEKKLYGKILHVSGKEPISRFDFSLLAAEIFALEKSLISPVTSDTFKQKAKRPKNSAFNTSYSEKILGFNFLDARETLLTYKKELES
ncbi:SDR family oxidoreductase [bacterium]|nr:SDR family oxidoreductase [bacterium]